MPILDDICTAKTKGIAAKDVAQTGKYPVFGATGLVGYLDTFEVEDAYVGIIKDGAGVGKTNIYPAKSSLLGTMQYILPKQNTDLKYLMYLLRSLNLGCSSAGAAIPHIYFKNYKKSIIPSCSVAQQKLISGLLEKIENLIDLKKNQLFSLDELVKSRFIEMFGDVKNNDKNFFVKKGTDLFKFSSGKFLEATKRLESGIPVYGGNGIAWYTSEPLINFDTIVIGRVGAYCGNVRKISGSNWITDNAIYIKEFKEKCFNLEFLEALMGEYDFAQFNDAAAQPKITQKPMENLYYIVPPIELQNTFAEFVKQVDKSKFIVQKQIDDLQELLDSKMDEYFG